MAATISKEDIKVFNVSNKFGFLVVSDSDEEEMKVQKTAKKNKTNTNASKKRNQNSRSGPGNMGLPSAANVVGLNDAPSHNIVNPSSTTLSKNAKRRLRKKKQAETAAKEEEAQKQEKAEEAARQVTEEERFQQQLEEVMRISKEEANSQNVNPNTKPKENGAMPLQEATKSQNVAEQNGTEVTVEEIEVEEEDLFLPVIEAIKDIIKRIAKEDIPITDIPIDNNQLLRKRALELQDINTEFKSKLHGLLRVGYKYKKKYEKEKVKNIELSKVLKHCKGGKKAVERAKQIVQYEESEALLLKQVEELSEELERERTRLHALQYDKKGVKKVSFSDDKQ